MEGEKASPRYRQTSSWEKQVFVVLLEVEELEGLLASLPASAFTLSSVWLVKEDEGSISRTSTYLPIDSQVYGYYREEDRVVMEEVYQISPGSAHVRRKFGSWSPASGLSLTSTHVFERRKDLQGHVFRGQTVNEPPYVVVDMEALQEGRVGRIQGIVGDIWHEVMERSLNFTTQLVPSRDGQWGALGGDGR